MTFRDGGRDVRFPERIIFEFFRLQQVRTESNIVFSIVPLIFSTAFPIFSFGTWNYIFQTLLVITLMVLKRSFCPGYLFSFVVGIGTFFCAFMTGRTVSLVQKFIGNHVEFYRLMKKEMVMPGKKMRHA